MAATSSLPNLGVLPGLPRDDDGAVFAAPWEAKAFALVVHLHQQGCFEWQEWVATLAGEIAADRERASETPYYQLWLMATEKLVAARGLVDPAQLQSACSAMSAAQTEHHDHEDHDHLH
ncbi:MAG: nitrile hydratase accessory protein [Gammaproteobacteria bacterium]|nr:nitrile hydratase accessory protein [Gammaproteobacteria bacterium]